MKNKNFMNWDNPGWAIITGSSSGIGKEFASQLAQQGFNLILTARREQKLKELKLAFERDFGIKVEIFVADLSINSDIEKLADYLKNFSDIDILINNAGYGVIGKFEKLDLKSHLNMIQVHNNAPIQLMYAVLDNMIKKNRGVIINTASLAAFALVAYNGLYSPTKSFLVVLAEVLGMELNNTDVRIQSLCPGFTHTEFHDSEELSSVKKSLPKIMWMDSQKVVEKSLRAAYKGKNVYIPGFLNWCIAKMIPKWLQKKVLLSQLKKK